jgi:signal peptidase I
MTMLRPRGWYLASLVLVLTTGAGCTSRAGVTADSTCGDYLGLRTVERHAAATRVSTDLRAFNAGDPMWATSLDVECPTAPDTTLRRFFAGQLALEVPSEAMERTVNVGDTVLVNTLAYRRGAPRRGEVVVFNAPESWRPSPAEVRFVKRVVATGGDHLVCCDPRHRLVVNGRALDEPYLYKDASGRSDPSSTDPFDIVVPDGRLWVLGDHRSHSADSLTHLLQVGDVVQATVPVQAVVGKAFAAVDARDRHQVRWLTVPSTYDESPARAGP